MFHLRDNFKTLIARAAAREFNRLANFVNNLSGGDFVTVERPDVPTADTPPKITLRIDELGGTFLKLDQSSGTTPETNDARLLVTNASGQVALHDATNTNCLVATDDDGKLKFVEGLDPSSTQTILVVKSLTQQPGDILDVEFARLTVENGVITGYADDDAFSLTIA